ncbi:hypothetical protein BLSTO_05238, partial [Blastocystis sp. subtype 1]
LEVVEIGDKSFKGFHVDAFEGLPSLREFTVGRECFMGLGALAFEGYAQLETIKMGEDSFKDFSSFTLKDCPKVKELEFYPSAFRMATNFTVQGNAQLEVVEVGRNSFTHTNGTLVVRDCERLRELKVGAGSFELFTTLELSGLDALQTLELGDVEAESGNFAAAALELKDLPKLQSLALGGAAFQQSRHVALQNLPAELVLQNMPELTSLMTHMSGDSKSFVYPRVLDLQHMPKLATVTLSPSAFKHRTSVVKEGVCSLVPSGCRHWRAGEVL